MASEGIRGDEALAVALGKLKKGGGGSGNVDGVLVDGVNVVGPDKIARIDTSKFQEYCRVHLTLNKSDDTPIEDAVVTVRNRQTALIHQTFQYSGQPIILNLPAGFEYYITCSQILGSSAPLGYTLAAVPGDIDLTLTYTVGGAVYGFYIDGSQDNPALKVTYEQDAVGATPAYMDFVNNRFEYGSWIDAWFMPRPVMLKSDGTVDYYLDPNDYTKKIDGVTPSDVTNESYDGNAMMQWGRDGKKIWTKIVPDANDPTSAHVSISDAKIDDSYHAYPFIDSHGNEIDYFYTPIYNGAYSTGNKMRSLSGMTCGNSQTGQTEIDRAQMNNIRSQDIEWTTEVFCDVLLINLLLILIGKSTNTQDTFGYGHYTGGSSASHLLRTGTMDDKGLFFGTPETTTGVGVKVFGMENWWGNQWRRYQGHVTDSSKKQLVKLTFTQDDGSTTTGYNPTGAGYIETDVVAPNGYITKEKFFNKLFVASAAGGSATTHYCDQHYQGASTYALRGGACYSGLDCGAFACNLGRAVSVADWSCGAALSCKPLAMRGEL